MEGAPKAAVRPSRSEQQTTFFRYPEYIRAVGGQLSVYTVLDYFSKSDFYESSCNNAILQMQSAASNVGAPTATTTTTTTSAVNVDGTSNATLSAWERKNDPFTLEQELRRFIGLEYILAHAKPPDLFVIHKRWRTSALQTNVLDVYYVLHGNVCLAADLSCILASRFTSTVSALHASLTLARNAQANFNPREGHPWRIAAAVDQEIEPETHEEEREEKDENDENSNQQKHHPPRVIGAINLTD